MVPTRIEERAHPKTKRRKKNEARDGRARGYSWKEDPPGDDTEPRARASVRGCVSAALARSRSTCVRPLTLRRGQQCQITGYVASAKLIARRPEFPPGLHPFDLPPLLSCPCPRPRHLRPCTSWIPRVCKRCVCYRARTCVDDDGGRGGGSRANAEAN